VSTQTVKHPKATESFPVLDVATFQSKNLFLPPTNSSSPTVVNRTSLEIPKARCFTVSSLLSPDECKALIDQIEELRPESVDWEYDPAYRSCMRRSVRATALADVLWKRILPLLQVQDIADVRPFGFGNEGTWAPYGINPVLRFSKYGKHKDRFAKHRDGSFVEDDDHR
jgi:hypothetical protein